MNSLEITNRENRSFITVSLGDIQKEYRCTYTCNSFFRYSTASIWYIIHMENKKYDEESKHIRQLSYKNKRE